MNNQSLPLDEVVVKSMNCYFSQICEVSASSGGQLSQHEGLNCHVTFDSDSLLFITKGGNKFYLPLDQQISRVFPMVEGVLVEFFVKAQSKLQQILYYQKNKSNIDIEQVEAVGKFCYSSITRHPLNPLKILGELGSNGPIPWYKSKQKITFLSPDISLLMTYNEQLNRNAIYIILANLTELENEYQFAYLPTQTYSLKNVAQYPHYEVLTQIIYESNQYETEVVDVKLIKSTKKNQLYIYARTTANQLKIYEVDLYAIKNSVRECGTIESCLCLGTTQLYPFDMLHLEPYSKSALHIDVEITTSLLNRLDDCVVLSLPHKLCHYHRDRLVYEQPINIQVGKINKGQIYNSHGDSVRLIHNFFDNCFDALISRTLELCLSEHEHFIIFLNKYKNGEKILSILHEMESAKIPIFHSMHLFWEELRLYETASSERNQLGTLLIELARICNRVEYIEYYFRQGFQGECESSHQNHASHQQVVDLFLMMTRMFLKSETPKNLSCIYSRTNFIFNYLSILINGQAMHIEPYSRTLVNHQTTKELFYRNHYPLLSQKVFHIDYYTALQEEQRLKQVRPESKEQKAFIFLIQNKHNHSDIMSYPQSIRAIFYWLLRQMRRNLHFSFYEDLPELGFNLIHRQDLFKNIKLYKKTKSIVPFYMKKPLFDEHIKTLVHTSTSEQYFLTSNASEMNKINNDLVFEEVDRLLSSSSGIKVKARDIESIPEHKWESQSQNILLKFANRKVSVLVGQGAFSLGTSRSFITDIIKIPKINLNGTMPNDIKITLDLKEDKQSIIYWPEFHSGMTAGLKLSRHVIPLSEDHLKTWIFYQKPDTPRRDHSGFLLSLGLLGYLKCFSPTDIYQYLKPNNQFTSVAILLGVSASNIGRSDENLSKTLVLHIPVLLPPSVDLQIPINVQTSALIGIGLLHKGTCNRTMTEMTLSQIGKKPCSDKCLDRQGYSLAAGWALGMICLGMKDSKENFRDLQLEERLIRFIEGGKVMDPPQSMMSTNFVNENKCSSIKEGNHVNLHITAPAALLAISMMYLKSNNYELASKISIPNSFNTIEQCNPNHILLKTVARNLIMWDGIKSSRQYMLKQIPELIRFIFDNSLKQVHEQYYLIYNVSEIDYQTITSIYASVLTGCALSMGLKFAGTGDHEAVESIKWHIKELKNIRIIKCEFANDPLNKNCIDQYELFSLLSTSCLALSLIMAGTCDIECLKIVRIIRKKFQDSKIFHYGFNMALNMAIGFIFLGYGNYTFNREDMSISSLLISIFPQFPNSPTDNKWHLQALRHFYVLAMEEKIFHAVDVDTNKVITVNAEMEFWMNDRRVKQSLNTPILLQESKKLLHVRIKDEDYFHVDFSFANSTTDPKAIYIKRKHFNDVSPALIDPKNVMSTDRIRQGILGSLVHEPRYNSLISNPESEPNIGFLIPGFKGKLQTAQMMKERRCEKQVYYSLLKEDKLEMFEIYLNMKRQLRDFIESNIFHANLNGNLSLLISFQKWSKNLYFEQISASYLRQLNETILKVPELSDYINNPYHLSKNIPYRKLSLSNMPSAFNLTLIKQAIKKFKNISKEEVQFWLLMSYPQCQFPLLQYILNTVS